MCACRAARGAMTIVDAVTSLGAHPVDAAPGAPTWSTAARRRGSARRRGWRRSCSGARAAIAKSGIAVVLSRRRAARGLLGEPEVSPHDSRAARLRAAGSAGRRRGGRARGPLGAPQARTTRRSSGTGRGDRSRDASAAGGAAVVAERRRGARRRRRGGRAQGAARRRSASRSAPASGRSPARSGASA